MSFGSFGSGPGPHQKLTSEYLARQLPVFQERVPTSPKVRDNMCCPVFVAREGGRGGGRKEGNWERRSVWMQLSIKA